MIKKKIMQDKNITTISNFPNNDIIISFYKDPKTGLSINNTFRNLLKAGHKFTLRQVQEAIKDLDEYHKAKAKFNRSFKT